MLGALSSGKRVDVGTYFVPTIQFVRWVDPDGHATRDALQAHLNELGRRHVSVTLTKFTDDGYFDAAVGEMGGSFVFTVRGRPSATASPRDGFGKGIIDCTSKKIKAFVIDGW
jgi:hypothetical protein